MQTYKYIYGHNRTVEVSNSTIEYYLPVDSQYSSPVEALHLIVESKSLPVEVNNSTFAR